MELDCLGCLAWKVSIFLIRKIHFLVSIFNNMFKVLLGTINIRGGREGALKETLFLPLIGSGEHSDYANLLRGEQDFTKC